MRAQADALTESLLDRPRPKVDEAELWDKHCAYLLAAPYSTLRLLVQRVDMVGLSLHGRPLFELAAELSNALFGYHKMLNDFRLPGGDRTCAALMNFEMRRVVEVTCDRLAKDERQDTKAAAAEATRLETRAAKKKVDAATTFWAELDDELYSALMPNTPECLGRDDLEEEDYAREASMKKWLQRRKGVSMYHADPLAEADQVTAATSAIPPPTSTCTTSTAALAPSSRATIALPSRAASPPPTLNLAPNLSASASDDVASLEQSELVDPEAHRQKGLPGPWAHTSPEKPAALMFSKAVGSGGAPSSHVKFMFEVGKSKKRWAAFIASFQEAAVLRIAPAPRQDTTRKRKAEDDDALAPLKETYLDLVGDLVPIKTLWMVEVQDAGDPAQDMLDSPDGFIRAVEHECWHWFLYLVAIGIPQDSFEFAALYIRARYHCVENAGMVYVATPHDM